MRGLIVKWVDSLHRHPKLGDAVDLHADRRRRDRCGAVARRYLAPAERAVARSWGLARRVAGVCAEDERFYTGRMRERFGGSVATIESVRNRRCRCRPPRWVRNFRDMASGKTDAWNAMRYPKPFGLSPGWLESTRRTAWLSPLPPVPTV